MPPSIKRRSSKRRHYICEVFVCPCVRESRTNIVSAIYWVFVDGTFTTDGLYGMDKRVKFLGQKVKSQGHGGVKHAPKCTFRLVSTIFHLLAFCRMLTKA